MSAVIHRVFDDQPAVRESTPLLVGLDGPSGGGKTFSALRLATGFQRVIGGDIFGIDTESNRMKHYADQFRFRHVPFGAPFSPLDYLAAIDHCVKKGAKTIIIDSMSHEHEGPGGILEMHEQEVQRLSRGDADKAERVKMLAWSRPKQMRRRLLNSLTQINANIVLCFRAKEKIKLVKGKSEPEQLGWMPVGGEEFVFEMTLCCLLLPGSKGVPTWKSEYAGERMMMKLPGQFAQLFGEPKQLDEDTGMKLAQWAAGAAGSSLPTVAEYDGCANQAAFDALEKRRSDSWKRVPTDQKAQLKDASDRASARIKSGARTDLAGRVPRFTVEQAIAEIRKQSTEEAVDAVLDAVRTDYVACKLTIPVEIDGAAHDRKEALRQEM